MPKQVKSQEYLRTVNIFYYTQMLIVLAFGLVVLFLIQSGRAGAGNPALGASLQTVLIVEILLSMVGGYFLFRYMMRKIEPSLELKFKMPKYFAALLIRSTLFELPALFAGIVAFLNVQLIFLAIIPLIFLIFYILRPTLETIIEDLDLNPSDRALLSDPNAIIAETN